MLHSYEAHELAGTMFSATLRFVSSSAPHKDPIEFSFAEEFFLHDQLRHLLGAELLMSSPPKIEFAFSQTALVILQITLGRVHVVNHSLRKDS